VKFDAFKNYELNDVNKAANLYTEKLKNLVKTPVIPEGYLSSWAQYTIQLQDEKQRDGLQAYLKEQGIPTMVYYPKPMHEQTAYLGLGYQSGDFPATESLCGKVLSLPMHPYLTEDVISQIYTAIEGFLKK
jgi:dTDP-4-amino-4,6-dideoxygalactose transaminase